MATKTQELQQKVCQRFGWSLVFTKLDSTGGNNDDNNDHEYKEDTKERPRPHKWQAEIVTGMVGKDGNEEGHHTRHVFVTEDSFEDDKLGKSAVSERVLVGLADEIRAWEALPVMELTQVFASRLRHLPILDSKDPTTWERFWSRPHQAVGIDAEGNRISPPVLVQIATLDFVILETPRNELSADLIRLLNDDSITKVFCDNFAHKDKHCLGLVPATSRKKDPEDYTKPPIVDLESLAMHTLGPTKTARGLGRLVALTMPELKVRIEKPRTATGGMKGRFSNIAKFALIEQGKMKPLTGLSDLTKREQQYAALDAWCTLKVYERMQ